MATTAAEKKCICVFSITGNRHHKCCPVVTGYRLTIEQSEAYHYGSIYSRHPQMELIKHVLMPYYEMGLERGQAITKKEGEQKISATKKTSFSTYE